MVKLTRAQREALKRVFDRQPIFPEDRPWDPPLTYRQFRKRVQPELGGYGAVMVPWCRMWLGIERDGYTHS